MTNTVELYSNMEPDLDGTSFYNSFKFEGFEIKPTTINFIRCAKMITKIITSLMNLCHKRHLKCNILPSLLDPTFLEEFIVAL